MGPVAVACYEGTWDESVDVLHNTLGFTPPPEYRSPAQQARVAAAQKAKNESASPKVAEVETTGTETLQKGPDAIVATALTTVDTHPDPLQRAFALGNCNC